MKTSFRFFKCVILAIILTFACQYSQAQFLKRLKNKITQTAADHVTNDAGNATDKAIDKTENAAGNAAKGNDNSSSSNDNNSNSSSVSSSNSSSGNSSAPHPLSHIKIMILSPVIPFSLLTILQKTRMENFLHTGT